nr:MAG TPA: Protein of unknown function (DUF1244) [Caudoviricetes sp.]
MSGGEKCTACPLPKLYCGFCKNCQKKKQEPVNEREKWPPERVQGWRKSTDRRRK